MLRCAERVGYKLYAMSTRNLISSSIGLISIGKRWKSEMGANVSSKDLFLLHHHDYVWIRTGLGLTWNPFLHFADAPCHCSTSNTSLNNNWYTHDNWDPGGLSHSSANSPLTQTFSYATNCNVSAIFKGRLLVSLSFIEKWQRWPP